MPRHKERDNHVKSVTSGHPTCHRLYFLGIFISLYKNASWCWIQSNILKFVLLNGYRVYKNTYFQCYLCKFKRCYFNVKGLEYIYMYICIHSFVCLMYFYNMVYVMLEAVIHSLHGIIVLTLKTAYILHNTICYIPLLF